MKATPSTHRPEAVPPDRFRNQATGCSPCLDESAAQGAARSAEVVQGMPSTQRAALTPDSGYPRG